MDRGQETGTSADENTLENKNETITIKDVRRANLTEVKKVEFKDCKNLLCAKSTNERGITFKHILVDC